MIAPSAQELTLFGGNDTSPPPANPRGPPLLCERAPATRPKGPRRSVLTIATDASYLRPWAGFLWNKLCYCGQQGLDFLLFLGNVKTSTGVVKACAEGRAAGPEPIFAVPSRCVFVARETRARSQTSRRRSGGRVPTWIRVATSLRPPRG